MQLIHTILMCTLLCCVSSHGMKKLKEKSPQPTVFQQFLSKTDPALLSIVTGFGSGMIIAAHEKYQNNPWLLASVMTAVSAGTNFVYNVLKLGNHHLTEKPKIAFRLATSGFVTVFALISTVIAERWAPE
jgi:ABC-type thiamin/hydroxymethylpyrimidine transport system permease subunit